MSSALIDPNYKEVIIPALKALERKGPVSLQAVVDDLKDVIADDMNRDIRFDAHIAKWRKRILTCAIDARISLVNMNYVSWKQVQCALKERLPEHAADIITDSTPSSSSTNTTIMSARLSDEQRKWVRETYDSIDDQDKWRLRGDVPKYVEDGMRALANQYDHHHLSHSLIFDPDDEAWLEHFSPDELQEIKSFRRPELPELPKELEEYIFSYRGRKDLKSLLRRRREVEFDPIDEPELYLARKAMIEASDLFIFNYLPFEKHTESDLIHRIWNFIGKTFDGSVLKVQSGEKGSLASVQRKNANRASLSLPNGQLQRKELGTKVDLCFSSGTLEYGCAEASLPTDMANTKTIVEGRLKLPRTLKDMFVCLAKEAPSSIREIKVGGFLISGYNLTAYIVDSPAGKVCRVTKVGPFEFPTSPTVFAKKLIPLLTLVWKMRYMMTEVVEVVENEDNIDMPSTSMSKYPYPIPHCMKSPKLVPRKRRQEDAEM